LGVTKNNQLYFKEHINEKCSRAYFEFLTAILKT